MILIFRNEVSGNSRSPHGYPAMVYVDDAKLKFGRMTMCHMVADTTAELLAMADTIGVARKWIQGAGTYREHFDVCLAMRARRKRHKGCVSRRAKV